MSYAFARNETILYELQNVVIGLSEVANKLKISYHMMMSHCYRWEIRALMKTRHRLTNTGHHTATRRRHSAYTSNITVLMLKCNIYNHYLLLE